MKVYLAHAISGRSGEEILNWYESTSEAFEYLGFTVLFPMIGKGYLRNEMSLRATGYEDFPMSTNHNIFERDKWMVTQADVVFVDLTDTTTASIGCSMELAWASMLGKHTVVVLPKENIHRHAFILEAADIIFEDIESATNYMEKLVNRVL